MNPQDRQPVFKSSSSTDCTIWPRASDLSFCTWSPIKWDRSSAAFTGLLGEGELIKHVHNFKQQSSMDYKVDVDPENTLLQLWILKEGRKEDWNKVKWMEETNVTSIRKKYMTLVTGSVKEWERNVWTFLMSLSQAYWHVTVYHSYQTYEVGEGCMLCKHPADALRVFHLVSKSGG